MRLIKWKDCTQDNNISATGQRTAKHVYSSSDVFEHSDYYVYDASGNLMSVYRKFSDANEQVLSYSLTERPIYGSSRLGVDKTTIEFIGYTPPTNGLTNHVVGLKQYEGSNHLGNVLTTFSDKKMSVDANSDGIIDYSTADITSSTDYYPFGVTMKGRDFTSNVSRFGFNGKEKDEETETMDFGARLLDGDLGLWLACDPKHRPNLSSYNFAANNPIIFVDPNGETEFYFNGKWVGTDGVKNGLIAVVSDDKLANEMRNITKKGKYLPEEKSLPDGVGAVNRNGVLIVDYNVLVYANYVLIKQFSKAGLEGEFALVLHYKNGKFYTTIRDAFYKKGDMVPIPLRGTVSIHGHSPEENSEGYTRADEPSNNSTVNEKTGEMNKDSDVEVFRFFEVNIIVGLNGELTNYKDEEGNSMGQNKRVDAINFFDSKSVLFFTIKGEHAAKMLEGKRGSLGKEFEKNRKYTNDQGSNQDSNNE